MIPDSELPNPLWVFGYGSLLWNPGFEVAEQRLARLDGYHRAFCMASIHHRGTEENPGLVLALDAAPGSTCLGVALRVAPGSEPQVLAGLRERELISSAYIEQVVTLQTETGAPFRALAYVVDRHHVQYRGSLSLDQQADIIARASGGRGPNIEYLLNTADHLKEIGVVDPDLAWLAARLRNGT